jgi:hypothetical protein
LAEIAIIVYGISHATKKMEPSGHFPEKKILANLYETTSLTVTVVKITNLATQNFDFGHPRACSITELNKLSTVCIIRK